VSKKYSKDYIRGYYNAYKLVRKLAQSNHLRELTDADETTLTIVDQVADCLLDNRPEKRN
jgi:hypothetical protein